MDPSTDSGQPAPPSGRPATDDADGALLQVSDLTLALLRARRAEMLCELAGCDIDAPLDELLMQCARILGKHDADLPFVLFYLFDEGGQARLAAAAGIEQDAAAAARIVWPLAQARESPVPLQLDDVRERSAALRRGPEAEIPRSALLLPIALPGQAQAGVVCVAGLSPRVPFDDGYRDFCLRLGQQLGRLVARQQLRSREREEFQALSAEVDQRKLALEALRLDEERQRFCLDAGGLGAWDLSPAQPEAWRSVVHDRIFGYPGMAPEWSCEIFLGHVVLEDRERVRKLFEAGMAGEGSALFECRIRRLDGALRWIEIRAQSVRDRETGAMRIYGTTRDITEQLALKETLQRQTEILKLVLNSMTEGVLVCDAQGELILANSSAGHLLRLDSGDVNLRRLGENYEWYSADGATLVPFQARPLARALAGEKISDCESLIRNRERGVDLIIDSSAAPLRDARGRIIGAVNVFRDVTENRRALRDLRSAEQHFKLLVEGTVDYAIFMLDAGGGIVSWNPGARRILGYEREEVLGRHVSLFYTPEDIEKGEPQRKLAQTVEEGRAEEDSWRVRKDGQRFWCTGVLDALHDEHGNVRGFVEIMRDNTERRLAEENTFFLANHDPLTGLPNRARFLERLHEALIYADRDATQVAVLLLDLDRFKLINDTMGHHVGDALLKKVASRLSKCIRETDTVARLGGDEFVIILTRLHDIASVELLAGKIVQEMGRPYQVNRQEVRSGASLGVAIYRRDGADAGELLQKADLAMYRAKSAGRNNYRIFAPSMLTEVQARREQEDNLRLALENREFELSFQPQIDLNTLRLTGAEVLLRSRNRVLQAIPTARIIALAEETGLIVPLGDWVLETACWQMAQWRARGLPEFKLAINFSPAHLLSPNFVGTLRRILETTGLDPRFLEFEVTEGLLVAASEANNEVMTALKEIGVSISVDDFGTGFSALSYLKNFPVDVLKLDESLVRHLPRDQDDVAIVSAIIKLALDLEIKVVAEGVETADQLAYLKTTDCKSAQGFLFSPAVRTDVFEALLQNRSWAGPTLH